MSLPTLPTPQEYAEVLGLQPGPHAVVSALIVGDALDRCERMMGIIDANVKAGVPTSRFWHEFASLYLPSFLGTYFGNPYTYNLSAKDEKNVYHILEIILRCDALGPALCSYARARPMEMVGFIHVHCQRMMDQAKKETISELEWAAPFFSPATSFRPIWFPILNVLLYHFRTVNFASNMHILFHGTAFLETQATLPRIEYLRDWIDPKDMPTFDLCLALLRSSLLPVGTVVDEPDSTWCTPEAGYICELYPRQLYIGARCERPAPGLEFAECARCKSVRYCSKDHQKADWKAHKKICFKPCWYTPPS